MGPSADDLQRGIEKRTARAARVRRRARWVVTGWISVVLALLVVPALAVRPMRSASLVVFLSAGVAALGIWMLPEIWDAFREGRSCSPDGRFLTARTLTGRRTVDLHDLRRVRGRILPGGRGGPPIIKYVMVTDAFGVRLALSEPEDVRRVRDGVRISESRGRPVRVSRLAKTVLGLHRAPAVAWIGWVSASVLWPAMLVGGCLAVVLLLAGAR